MGYVEAFHRRYTSGDTYNGSMQREKKLYRCALGNGGRVHPLIEKMITPTDSINIHSAAVVRTSEDASKILVASMIRSAY